MQYDTSYMYMYMHRHKICIEYIETMIRKSKYEWNCKILIRVFDSTMSCVKQENNSQSIIYSLHDNAIRTKHIGGPPHQNYDLGPALALDGPEHNELTHDSDGKKSQIPHSHWAIFPFSERWQVPKDRNFNTRDKTSTSQKS